MRQLYNGFETITITAIDQKTRATIVPARGGYVSSLMLPFESGTREVLFLHENAWANTIDDLVGGIPFLFPICGRLSRNNITSLYLYNGKEYHLKIHGFSWYLKWEVSSITDNSVTIVLQNTPYTLKHFPFHFKIELTYTVTPGQLICKQVYFNTDHERPMPFYAGFHPYFLTPPVTQGKEKVLLTAEFTSRLQYNDTLTDIIDELPNIKTPISITMPEINEQLCILGNNKVVSLTFPNGDVLNTKTENKNASDLFCYMQLYTMIDKPFFCIERWMSFVNAMNTAQGVQWLGPLEKKEASFIVYS